MSSRWKKVWPALWHNKTRSILTILTIGVGALAIGFNSNLQQYMVASMESDFLSVNPSEATIAAYPLHEESLRVARGVPGVNGVEGQNIASAKVIRPDGAEISIVF